MADETEFGENVAESTVAYNDFQLDPAYHDGTKKEPSKVWAESQILRRIVEGRDPKPAAAIRDLLKRATFRQIRSLELYRAVGEMIATRVPTKTPAQNEVTLYVLLFPGEGKDKTGVKDLNDKVLTFAHTSTFVIDRNKAIAEVFSKDGYTTLGQDYKTSSILARGKKPEDVKKDLTVLDGKIVAALDKALDEAIADSQVREEFKVECRKLKQIIKKKGYRFDFLFGARTRPIHGDQLDNTFLLLTEALKGAGISRFGVKGRGLTTRLARGRAAGKVPGTLKGHDDRGQPYDPNVYLRVSAAAPDIKKFVVSSGSQAQPVVLNRILVDKVWTDAFLLYRRLFFGNPDVIRDVRKRSLVKPTLKQGIKFAFEAQREILELWLVALNLIDFITGFLKEEFDEELLRLHRSADISINELLAGPTVNWDRLTPILTSDVRQAAPIAVLGATSEYQFYAYAADYPQQIFFTFDIRDLGVDLMLFYELANKKIVDNQLTDEALLAETLSSSDHTVERKRATYDAVRDIFRRYHDTVVFNARFAADLAMGVPADKSGPLPPFDKSIQLMMGGDEIFVAAHPLYAAHVTRIIQDLDHLTFGNQLLNLRAGVAFSSAEQALVQGPDFGPRITPDQRKNNESAHDEALSASSNAPNILKPFERAHRRLERIIDRLADSKDKKKNDLAPAFDKRLTELKLLELYARAKHGQAKLLPKPVYARLIQALKDENVKVAEENGAEIIDFSGKVVNGTGLLGRAETLEVEMLKALGSENFHVDPPPVNKAPKVPKWILDLIDFFFFPRLHDEEQKKKKKGQIA